MKFSDELEAKFEELIRRYPEGKQRSALIPMLLYAQDELGYISDEVAAEICHRLGLKRAEVDGVITYYSMLRRKPLGRYHIQICTNISCMLRGAEELFEHAKRRLNIGNKQATPDGMFSLEEVECIGACCWAPAIQVNYTYHHNVTPEKLDQIIEELRRSEKS